MIHALRDSSNNIYPVGARLQIGSVPGNQIILSDPKALPFHAILWEQSGILYLQDNSGGVATFLNQLPVQGAVALQLGDQLVLGSTYFTVVDLNAPPSTIPIIQNQVSTSIPAVTTASTSKKRKGCGGWILTALLVFGAELVLIVIAALILAGTDVEVRGGIQDLKAFMAQDNSADVAPSDKTKLGPAILTLSDTWLTGNFTESFTQHQTRSAEGLSLSGTTSSAFLESKYIQQGYPNWLSYSLVSQIANDKVLFNIEYGIKNNSRYSNENNSCLIGAGSPDGLYYMDQTAYTILKSELTGHVKLIEEGVSVNGVIADRYQLRMDNFANAETVLELISGDLYRAREGGYLVQLDYVIKVAPQSWVIAMGEDFSETDPAQVTYHFDRIYAPDGSLTIEMPEVCAGMVP